MEEIAAVYAHALFEVAKERDQLAEVRDELGEFAKALDENRQLATSSSRPTSPPMRRRTGFGAPSRAPTRRS